MDGSEKCTAGSGRIDKLLKEVFRFWGYGRQAYEDLVGQGRPINIVERQVPAPMFGRVELCDEVLARFGPLALFCRAGWWSWLLLDGNVELSGEPLAWFHTSEGKTHALITRTADCAYCFGFDLDRTIRFTQNEHYCQHSAPFYVKLGVNPDQLPGWARLFGFRLMHAIRGIRRAPLRPFPTNPADPSVDGWRYLIRNIVEDHSSVEAFPLWPDGKKYAVTLSHDIDTDYCFRVPDMLTQVRETDERAGMRAAWMVVAKLAGVGKPVLDDLHAAGHEIGFHGTDHDHKLAFLPPVEMGRRIARASELIERYGTTGFRSPSYLRTPALYQAIDGILEYDMSMHDATEGVCRSTSYNEGCSTCLPFFIAGTDVLEIPTTVREDWHYDLLGLSDPFEVLRQQIKNTELIKARGGVASILSHPEPTATSDWLSTYAKLLDHLARDEDAWMASPQEINRHWRRRQAVIDASWALAHEASAASVSAMNELTSPCAV
ncbi:MAG: polysaccharide deacetylase family protein [Phycisphaerae bacterium]